MKHIVYNPDGNAKLKVKVELLNPDSLTEDQKELAEAFLDGANFVYYSTISDSFVSGVSQVIDNSMPGNSEVIRVDYLMPLSETKLPTLFQKDAQIVFEKIVYDDQTEETTPIIDPIPVKITPILNGVEIDGDSKAIPKTETIAEMIQYNTSVLLCTEHLKTKEATKLPSYRTSTFNILDGYKKIENVYFNIYVIKGDPQNIENMILLEESMETYGNILGIMLDGGFDIRMNYFEILDRCMNFVGNINTESEPKTFDYVQVRLFDSNGNDLSLNNKEYKVDFSNPTEEDPEEGMKGILLNVYPIDGE